MNKAMIQKTRVLKNVTDETVLKPADTVENYAYTAKDGHRHLVSIGPLVVTTRDPANPRNSTGYTFKLPRTRAVTVDGQMTLQNINTSVNSTVGGAYITRVGRLCRQATMDQLNSRMMIEADRKAEKAALEHTRALTKRDNWKVSVGEKGSITVEPIGLHIVDIAALNASNQEDYAWIAALSAHAPALLQAIPKDHAIRATILLSQQAIERELKAILLKRDLAVRKTPRSRKDRG